MSTHGINGQYIMMLLIKAALAATAVTSLLVVATVQRSSTPEVEATPEQQFEEAWLDNLKVMALTKADRERVNIAALDTPKTVATERVSTDASAGVPPVIVVEETPKPPSSRRRRHVREAHNKKKRDG